jgi:hypothetical protein
MKAMTTRWGALLLGFLVTATQAEAQAIHVVDASSGAGTDFTALPSAVESAADGDVILVRTGSYDPLVISGKGVIVTADRGATVTISETLHVDNLTSMQSVSINGLSVDATDVAYAGTFEDCAGPVMVSNCSFDGSGGPLVSGGLFAANCASVTFVNVTSIPTLTAGASVGRAAMFAYNTSVYAYGCNFMGSDGVETLTIPIPGAHGAQVLDSFFFAAGCTLSGGDGGNGTFGFLGCTDGGAGGDGAQLSGTTPSASLLDVTATGGTGGFTGGPGCVAGANGMPVRTLAGTVTNLAGTWRSHSNDSPAREQQALTSTYNAPAGEGVLSVIGFGQEVATFFPANSGASHLDPVGFVTLLRGLVPGGGTLVSSPVIPELGIGFEGLTLVEQPLFVDLNTLAVVIGNPADIVLLDDSL